MDDMKVMFVFIRVMLVDESYVPVNESYHYKMAFGLCAWKQTKLLCHPVSLTYSVSLNDHEGGLSYSKVPKGFPFPSLVGILKL